jgi:hypothetical protein
MEKVCQVFLLNLNPTYYKNCFEEALGPALINSFHLNAPPRPDMPGRANSRILEFP